MTRLDARVLVLGGGPGGYVAAIRCAQLGLDTVLVERDRLGGTCLVRGCIPSKAVIHAAGQFESMARIAASPHLGISLPGPPRLDLAGLVGWKDGIVDRLSGGVAGLLERAGVRVVRGDGRFADARTCVVEGDAGDTEIGAEHVILAAGSQPVALPSLPFGGAVISSGEALSLASLPGRLVVVGGGYIGLELGSAFARLGAAVAIVEAQDRILPNWDAALTEPVRRALLARGVALHLGASVIGPADGGGVRIGNRQGETVTLAADTVLVTVGRQPATAGWGLERMGVAMRGRFVGIDDRCATSVRGVWAIGDLVGEPMLAHKASAQGEMVAEIIAGHRRRFDPATIAAVCFTEPEIVAAGPGPEQCDAAEIVVSSFPFLANGRALSMDAGGDGGFVRVVSRRDDHRILGIQAVGRYVSELSGQFVTAIEMGAVLEDVAGIIQVHPTLGEAFHEAALKGLGHAIHL